LHCFFDSTAVGRPDVIVAADAYPAHSSAAKLAKIASILMSILLTFTSFEPF
jgi:hypothetical protein